MVFSKHMQIWWAQHSLKYIAGALSGVAQSVGHHPTKQKVASLIPGQGTRLACGFGLWTGRIQEATDRCFSHINVSVPLVLPPLTLKIRCLLKQKEIHCRVAGNGGLDFDSGFWLNFGLWSFLTLKPLQQLWPKPDFSPWLFPFKRLEILHSM